MIIAFFLFMFAVTMPIGISLLVKQRENRLLVWGALIILTAGLSGLQVGLEKVALPYLRNLEANDAWLTALSVVTAFLNVVIHAFPYYLILAFFLHYAGYSNPMVVGLLLVPVLLSFLFSEIYPDSKVNYSYILSWGIPYMLASVTLFAKRLLQVGRGKVKKLQYFGVGAIFLIPEALLLLIQLDGIYFQSPVELLVFIPILCLLSILLGLILYVYNVFTRFQSATVLTKMQMGTSLMQHAFKNAISKNKLHALNIRRSLDAKQYENIDQHLAGLLKSNDHLMELVAKLSYLTKSKVSIDPEPTDISIVLDETVDAFRHAAVSIEKQYMSCVLNVDRALIAECCSNIIGNAIEAMDGRGRLIVQVEKINRYVKIHFTDTGKGMNKEQLSKMFEPFYSTKYKTGQNFGLGMFHVRTIMNAHRGKVKVTSQPGNGTTVTLIFT